MVSILGVEFAPIWIPLERRLQTFAVFQWTLSFLMLGPLCLALMVYLLFTPFYAIPLLYSVWYVYDWHATERGGRRCLWVRNWQIWKYFRDYFPVKLVKTSDLDPTRNYIFGVHPHGIMCDGAFCNFATEATGFTKLFPGIRPYLITINYQFYFPLHREYFMSAGACSCSLASMRYILTERGTGNALALIVGGAFESLEANPGCMVLNLSRRKGFIRLALEHGACLVPVFSFGENDIFCQASNPPGSRLRRLQILVAKYAGFAMPIFYGRGVFNYTFGLVPYRKPITTVVGCPIDVDKVENPSISQIDSLHGLYIKELIALFEKHKLDCGLKDTDHLVIE